MPIWDYLQSQPAAWTAFAAVIGAMVGSFLNVVIYRLPKMMEREWQKHCAEVAETPHTGTHSAYNLAIPRSQCPGCGKTLSAWELIPIASYFLQRGRCRSCGQPIGARYPTVEALTALLTAFTAWHFGFGALGAAACLAVWMLIGLSFIDLDHHLLPDSMTLPLLWIGLILSVAGVTIDSGNAILGATAGYGLLWSVFWIYKLITGLEGLGYGDFKLLGALGAWFGWQAIPLILLLASFAGAVFGLTAMAVRGGGRHMAIPFGPYLAAAGWLYLIWGKTLTQWYLRVSGLG